MTVSPDAGLAGFALVDRKSRLSGANDVWDMAEFFVLRRHRRSGVGLRAAHQLFAMHPGNREVRQRNANVAATSFWRTAISAFTRGTYSEELVDDVTFTVRMLPKLIVSGPQPEIEQVQLEG